MLQARAPSLTPWESVPGEVHASVFPIKNLQLVAEKCEIKFLAVSLVGSDCQTDVFYISSPTRAAREQQKELSASSCNYALFDTNDNTGPALVR